MKFLRLKSNCNKLFLLFCLTTSAFVTENLMCSPHEEEQTVQPEMLIARVLERCIFAKDELNPFSYYIDELIALITQHKDQLEKKFSKPGLAEQFINDLKKIRSIKKVLPIGNILRKYKPYLPASSLLRKSNLDVVTKGLKHRLSITKHNIVDENGVIAESCVIDETVIAQNEGMLNAFIGYCKLLLESGREYFKR